MALVNISEAAKLSNKNRTTLYRYIKQGKLSVTTDVTGKDKIDTSELLRVFGSLKETSATQNDTPKSNITQRDATQKSNDKMLQLEAKVQRLEQQLTNKEELLQSKNEHIESLNKALLLLEYREQNNQQVATKKTWWKIFL